MLDVKYYKDLSHNYLIIKARNNTKDNMYQSKMLEENSINYLLPCHIRCINEELFFYYEISSKQNMESLFERGKITYSQLFYLFDFLWEASKALKEYLLQDSRILLKPEYIYTNPEGSEYYFVYFPYIEEEDNTLYTLGEFLTDKADRGDERGVEIIYDIYERIIDDRFILAEILHLFDRGEMCRTDEKERETQQEPADNMSEKCEIFENRIPENEEMSFLNKDLTVKGALENTYVKSEGNFGNRMVSAVFFFFCIAALAGLFGIRYFFELSYSEALFTGVGIVVLILLTSFLLLYLAAGYIRERSEEPQREENGEEEGRPWEAKSFYSQPDGGFMLSVASLQEGKEEYGNTVFLEASLLKRENKLYGINKGNKYHIDLNRLPCTVGKMAGSVDFVIKEDSISRIHARFTKNGKEVYVTDLNSTNGTFKNGLRLEPNETMVIEPGDELRFGKMTFCYR